ncbi:MAG: hypothetical protein HQK83_18035 [Fibrobacteria bacterium]|nr:hypothetical protein [Fibrobacteria bacterium]
MTHVPLLNIELKKGDPDKLKGKLIAYANVENEGDSDSAGMGAMVKNGILAVQANYVDQRNIKDFFQVEFGVSLEKGIQEIIEQAKENGGLEGALDPNVVREKLESMRNMEFIPIPAKIAFFDSLEEMLQGDEDVYYLGKFKIISHAHLCVNSFPILYQAKFREQEHMQVIGEIEDMLKTLSPDEGERTQPKAPKGTIDTFKGNIKDLLFKDLIPQMLYNIDKQHEYKQAEHQFRDFMAEYSHPEDIEEIIALINSDLKDDQKKYSQLELMVDKIEALQNENYEQLELIKRKMKDLE